MTEPSLRGSLASFRLPDVLTFLATTRKSGRLTVAHAGRESAFFFDAGALVYAGSNQEPLRLGRILLRRNRISVEQRDAIDALMQRDGARFGELAVQQGLLTPDQLRDFLKVQVSEVLYDALLWPGGEFGFVDDAVVPQYAVTISIDLSNLIMEGARRIEEWEECVRLLPDSSVVFRVVSTPDAEKITLSLEEWKVLFLINGSRTLEELAQQDENPLHVYRVVYGLLGNKLIEPVTRKPNADDTGRTIAVTPLDETFKQPPATFGGDSTVREVGDDTSLLVSSDAKLSYRDVVKPTVAQLVIMNGDEEGLMIPLTEAEYLIGRQRDNTIQLPDLAVSGHHARIYRAPDGYTLEDLKSRNGTWLNGDRAFHTVLRNGDVLRLGATEMRYDVLYDGTAGR